MTDLFEVRGKQTRKVAIKYVFTSELLGDQPHKKGKRLQRTMDAYQLPRTKKKIIFFHTDSYFRSCSAM